MTFASESAQLRGILLPSCLLPCYEHCSLTWRRHYALRNLLSPIPLTMSHNSRFLHCSHSFPTLLIQISFRLHICTTCINPSRLFAPFLLTLSIRLRSPHCSFPEPFYLYSVLIIQLNVRGSTPNDTAAVSSNGPHICHPHHPFPPIRDTRITSFCHVNRAHARVARMSDRAENDIQKQKATNGKTGHKKT